MVLKVLIYFVMLKLFVPRVLFIVEFVSIRDGRRSQALRAYKVIRHLQAADGNIDLTYCLGIINT